MLALCLEVHLRGVLRAFCHDEGGANLQARTLLPAACGLLVLRHAGAVVA